MRCNTFNCNYQQGRVSLVVILGWGVTTGIGVLRIYIWIWIGTLKPNISTQKGIFIDIFGSTTNKKEWGSFQNMKHLSMIIPTSGMGMGNLQAEYHVRIPSYYHPSF